MPAIRTEIFQTTFTASPQAISAPILALCRELGTDRQLVWVSILPEPGALMSECFSNVSAKVASEGGTLLYGWTIWE